MHVTDTAQAKALGGDILHHFGGGTYAKEMQVPAGMVVEKHMHDFTHLSILASGKAAVTIDGKTQTITGPHCLTVEAGKQHTIFAITNLVWYCVHATECTDADEVDQVLIKEH